MSANGISGPHGSDQTVASPPPQTVSLDDVSFHDVLRALNPLQYVPVVGTIYRLTTGDAAPSGLRMAVSAIGGVLMGGPFGLLSSIGGMLAENFFHLEDRARTALAAPAATVAATEPAPAAAPQAVAAYRAAGLLGAV